MNTTFPTTFMGHIVCYGPRILELSGYSAFLIFIEVNPIGFLRLIVILKFIHLINNHLGCV